MLTSWLPGHKMVMLLLYLYLSCGGPKNTALNLLRDICWCCKEALLSSKCCGHTQCAVVQQVSKLHAHFTEVSKWLAAQCGCAVSVICYQKLVANRHTRLYSCKLEWHICVVTKLSTLLIITLLSSGFKKLHMPRFCKYKYLHVTIASLAIVKSCVTISPSCGCQMFHLVHSWISSQP